MDMYVLWIVAGLATLTLLGMLWKMKSGIGPYNLRAFGIVLLATFAALLVIVKPSVQSAAIAILGAIAGYLFSFRETREKDGTSSVDVESSSFGSNAKIAGRDINETIENMRADLAEVKNSIINQYQAVQDADTEPLLSRLAIASDYFIVMLYERGEQVRDAFESTVRAVESDGWRLAGFSSDYQNKDGVMLLFARPRKENKTSVLYHHGSLR